MTLFSNSLDLALQNARNGVKTAPEAFQKMLGAIDWHYEKSDDERYFQKGERDFAIVNCLISMQPELKAIYDEKVNSVFGKK